MKVLLVRAASIASALDEIVAAVAAHGGQVTVTDSDGFAALAGDDWDILAGPGSMRCDAAFFTAFARLRAVIAIGSGVEGIDRAAATAAGVLIGHGGTQENVEGMAEAAVMLMLTLLHDLAGSERGLREELPPPAQPRGRMLADSTVGLIGYGVIGRAVARRLRPWRARVLAQSPHLPPGVTDEGAEACGLDRLLAQSDVVSLHAGLNAQTRNLLDAGRLAAMKPGAVLINLARGGMVDEVAVARMLCDGRLGGAAFDVFASEPLAADSPLRTAPNVILTPHTVGHTAAGARSVIEALVKNIGSVLDGRPPPLLRNPEALEAWLSRPSFA